VIKILTAAVREYRSTALTRAFLFAVIVFPLLILAVVFMIGKSGLLESEEPPLEGVVLVQDTTRDDVVVRGLEMRLSPAATQLAASQSEAAKDRLKEQFPSAPDRMLDMMISQLGLGVLSEASVRAIGDDEDLDPYKERLRTPDPEAPDDEALAALIVAGPEILNPLDRSYKLYHRKDLDKDHIRLIRQSVQTSIQEERARLADVDLTILATLAAQLEPEVITLTEAGETKTQSGLQIIVPAAFFFLIWTSVMYGGQYLLMSTIEEKSSRVMEVVLSAISPLQLLIGKIIGQGGVGLTILVIYLAVGMFAAGQFEVLDQIPRDKLPWLVLYFLMAYFFFAGLMAAVGSAVTEIREAQTLMGPIMTLLMIPLILWIFILEDPNSTFAVAVSFIPPVTPFVMTLRMSQIGQDIPMWEVIATTIVGFAGVVVVVWAAAKIFRVGVLMYGKPPTLLTLVKWIRYA
jgi:ABC-2 type transport system permease protein